MNGQLSTVQRSNMAPMKHGNLLGIDISMRTYPAKRNCYWMRWHAAVKVGHCHVILNDHVLKILALENRI